MDSENYCPETAFSAAFDFPTIYILIHIFFNWTVSLGRKFQFFCNSVYVKKFSLCWQVRNIYLNFLRLSGYLILLICLFDYKNPLFIYNLCNFEQVESD